MVRQNGVPIDSLQIEAQKKRIVKGMIGAAVAAIGAVFTTQYVFSSCFNNCTFLKPTCQNDLVKRRLSRHESGC